MSGIIKTDTIMDKIMAAKREQVAAAQGASPPALMREAAEAAAPPRDFRTALSQSAHVALIAEVKRASPSKGVMIDPFEPVALAEMYQAGGAAAISILTDEPFFGGHLDHLKAIRAAVDLPLLRKEFIIDPYQVYEARAAGADAVLLIVAALEDGLLAELHSLIESLGMAALVEVHDEAELERALKIKPRLIGVNNRDLRDFSMNLNTTRRLAGLVPPEVILVGESGIKTADDVRALGAVHAILVGETVVMAADRAAKLHELTHVERNTERRPDAN